MEETSGAKGKGLMARKTSSQKRNWIGKAAASMKRRGTKGTFSKSAKQAGMSTGAYANKVLSNPKASPLQKKRANFARNAIKASKGG